MSSYHSTDDFNFLLSMYIINIQLLHSYAISVNDISVNEKCSMGMRLSYIV